MSLLHVLIFSGSLWLFENMAGEIVAHQILLSCHLEQIQLVWPMLRDCGDFKKIEPQRFLTSDFVFGKAS